MDEQKKIRTGKMRTALATTGMIIGGLAPLITGAVGIYGYATRGYFIAKTGELISSPVGLMVSIAFVLAGLAMIVYALHRYCNHE